MAAISAAWSGVSGPVQPNMVFENVARWSKGSTYRGRLYPIAMALTSRPGDVRLFASSRGIAFRLADRVQRHDRAGLGSIRVAGDRGRLLPGDDVVRGI